MIFAPLDQKILSGQNRKPFLRDVNKTQPLNKNDADGSIMTIASVLDVPVKFGLCSEIAYGRRMVFKRFDGIVALAS